LQVIKRANKKYQKRLGKLRKERKREGYITLDGIKIR
jgi:hypothetical protein